MEINNSVFREVSIKPILFDTLTLNNSPALKSRDGATGGALEGLESPRYHLFPSSAPGSLMISCPFHNMALLLGVKHLIHILNHYLGYKKELSEQFHINLF